MASEIKELNKNLATKITALLRIHKTELMKQIQEADKGMSETSIKDLIDRSMLEFDDKISKSVAAKVRKEKQRMANTKMRYNTNQHQTMLNQKKNFKNQSKLNVIS